MRVSRGALVAAVLAVVAAGAALAQTPITEKGFVPAVETRCYTCHGPGKWNPPLREFVGISPAEDAGASNGQEFAEAVQLRAVWTPKGNDPVLQNTTATLDITNAPSLKFGGVLPDQNEAVRLQLSLDPTTGSTTVTRGTTFNITSGVTTLDFAAVPDTASLTPPDISLIIDAGPGTQPIVVNDNGPGLAEEKVLPYEEISKLPIGIWTVRVSYEAVVPGATPQFAPSLDVDVSMHGNFDLQQLRSLQFALPDEVRAGQVLLQNWPLIPSGDPAPGENVSIVVKGHAYYDHAQYPYNEDITDFVTRLDVPVVKEGDKVLLKYESKAFAPEILNGPTMATVSEAVGYASALLLVSSIWSGGMFGMASRRQLNRLFVSAKRRVAFHNFLSYGLMAAAAVHTVLFLVEGEFLWTVGLIWGNIAILCMAALGVTGALQVQLIKRWGYAGWRWTHYGLAVGAIVFTMVHGLLDGVHFGAVQKAVGWEDPFTELLRPS